MSDSDDQITPMQFDVSDNGSSGHHHRNRRSSGRNESSTSGSKTSTTTPTSPSSSPLVRPPKKYTNGRSHLTQAIEKGLNITGTEIGRDKSGKLGQIRKKTEPLVKSPRKEKIWGKGSSSAKTAALKFFAGKKVSVPMIVPVSKRGGSGREGRSRGEGRSGRANGSASENGSRSEDETRGEGESMSENASRSEDRSRREELRDWERRRGERR